MGKSKKLPAALAAMDVWRNDFVGYFRSLGLRMTFDQRDHTINFQVTQVADLSLHGYYEIDDHAKKSRAQAVCVLGIGDSCSRVSWESDKGWVYSMMGVEDERILTPHAKRLLKKLNKLLGANIEVRSELTIDKAWAEVILRFHADQILAARKGNR